MWGSWLTMILGATVGLLLLIVGFAFGGWPVLAALAIFAVIGSVMLAIASWRRSGEYVESGDDPHGASDTDKPAPSRAGDSPRSGGAPASGEG